MDTERWERIGDIFERLLGTPLTQRPTLLDSLCGDDAELKKIVESMLESEDSAQRFEQAGATARKPTDSNLHAQETIDAAFLGTRVGPWAIERKLGSGGMGVVWLAQRADGQFEQRVALKLIKRGMDSEAVLARFLRERQILARLQHQHIAHLIDGGVTADGRPYFAMEYVDGVPLMRYCHEHGATLEKRIKLFLDVCSALQFAHEQHVVHRDLKPSNILVTTKGEVKLLDFGIAKLIHGEDGALATLTDMQRERPMTPAYAAPEQIAGGRISEQTDVYALGCVLYELLTGRHTHDFSAAAGAKDILQIVQSTDPVAPSKLKIVAAPVSLRRLRGDLDTIVLTALKRDPARRYASIAAFAADLKSYLDGAPIAARRDSVFYRAYKFSRRHRAGIAAIASVLAIAGAAITIELRERAPPPPIAPGSAMAIVDFNNLSQDKDNAWLATALAEMLGTQLAIGGTLHAVPDELVRPARADLALPLAGGYSQQSLSTLRKRLGTDYVVSGSYLVSGGAGDAKVHLDLAMQDARNGRLIANVVEAGALGDLPALVTKAGLSLRERTGFAPITASEEKQVGNAQPPNTEVARRMGNALDALRKSDPARARDELLEAVALAPGYAPANVYLSQAWKALGYDAKALAAAQQAQTHSENLPPMQRLEIDRQVAVQKGDWPKVLSLDKQLIDLSPADPELHFALVRDLSNSGNLNAADTALAKLRELPGGNGPREDLEAATIAQLRGDVKSQVEYAQHALQQAKTYDETALVANAERELGIALNQMGKHDDGEALTRQAIVDFQRSANPKGEAGARTDLAILLTEKNQMQPAREEYERASKIFQSIGDQQGLAAIYGNMANELWDRGERDAAETAVRRALTIWQETGDLSHQAWATIALAQIQLDDNAGEATMESYRRATSLYESTGERSRHVMALVLYAEGLRIRGDLESAQKTCTQAQEAIKLLTDSAREVSVDFECAAIALDLGDVAKALMLYQHSADGAARNDNKLGWARAQCELARIDIFEKRFDQAKMKLESATKEFFSSENISEEAYAQAMLASASIASGSLEQGARAASRARELRSAMTTRLNGSVVDRLLAEALGSTQPATGAKQLMDLADEAQRRQWTVLSLEARFAALQLLEKAKDPRALSQRSQLLTLARAQGFGWLLLRLSNDAWPHSGS